MPTIAINPEKDICARCGHTRESHIVGTNLAWCAVRGCTCQNFVERIMYSVRDLRALLRIYPQDARVFALLGQIIIFDTRGQRVELIETPSGGPIK